MVYERFFSLCILVMGKMIIYMRGWLECMLYCCYFVSVVICSDGACGKISGFNECKFIVIFFVLEKELFG